MTNVTTTIFVRRTPGATADPIDVLVALAAMFSKINSSTEHATDVGVTFIKSLLYDCVYERTAMEEHSFVRLRRPGTCCRPGVGRAGGGGRAAVSSRRHLFSHLLSSVCVTFPEFSILDFLYLKKVKRNDD